PHSEASRAVSLIAPAQPPLPTAWNLPFHPLAGSQTSTLISESLEGLSVAATRQNAGRFLNAFLLVALLSVAVGGANSPAATSPAEVTVASFSVSAVS